MKINVTLFATLMLFSACLLAQPDNDSPCNALSINVDGVALASTNEDATLDAGEPAPPAGDCANAWCDDLGPEFTTWFSFVCPSNGAAIINTCLEGTSIDTQLAVWAVGDCADYGTFTLAGVNDDSPDGCSAGDQYASTLFIDGLEGGAVYYIQFDGWGGQQGAFSIEVTSAIPSCLVNIAHNAADLALSSVDVWVNGALAADNLDFQTCTGYMTVPAETSAYVVVSNAASVDDTDPIFSTNLTLDPSKDYLVIATGIYSESGYTPAPAFELVVHETMMTSTGSGIWSILTFGGATDQVTVDLEYLTEGTTLFNDITYGAFHGTGYVEAEAGNISVDMTDDTGNNSLGQYCLQLPFIGPAAITLVSSGFVNPAENSNGAPFGWYFVTPFGGPFVPIVEGACPIPFNDTPCNAIELEVDAPPMTFDNTFATADEGEVNPPNLPLDDPEADCVNAWCDGEPVSNTLWFRFVAPATGSVGISTCFANSFDTQVAVWTIPNTCDDYDTFGFHQCNDDTDPICDDGDQFASAFQVFYLTPGNMHWIQLDGWGGTTGSFDIVLVTLTSVDEQQAIPFTFYPNPASDLLFLQCDIRGADALISDMSGRTVKRFQVNGQQQHDVSDLPSGIYTLTLHHDGMHSSSRLVIE